MEYNARVLAGIFDGYGKTDEEGQHGCYEDCGLHLEGSGMVVLWKSGWERLRVC